MTEVNREIAHTYTPGPWKARHVRDISLSSWIVQANGCTVADCSPFDDDGASETNARLIAAAPEAVEELLYIYQHPRLFVLSVERRARIRAILQKAGVL